MGARLNTLARPAAAKRWLAARMRRWASWPPPGLGTHRARITLFVCLAFAIWGWVDVRLRGMVKPDDPTWHKTDFTVYTEAGAAFFDGREPYAVTNPRGWGYLYPPAFAMLVAPLHALPTSAQVLVWFAVSVWIGWGCYRECVRIGRIVLPGEPDRGEFGPIPNWIGCAGVVAVLLPALNCLQRGQVGILKLYLLLLGFRLLLESRSRGRSWLAGAVLAAPIVLKITPVVPVAVALFQQALAGWFDRGERSTLSRATMATTGTACGLVLLLFVLPSLFVGFRANLRHLDSWWNTIVVKAERSFDEDFAGDSASKRNQSLINSVRHCGNWIDYYFAGGLNDEIHHRSPELRMSAPVVDKTLLVARAALACLLVVVAFRAGQSGENLRQAAGFGLACVSTLILAPVARGHYFVLFLPATIFVCLWLARHERIRSAVALAAISCLLVIAHYVALNIAGRVGLLGIGTTLWFIAASILVAWPSRTMAARDQMTPPRDRPRSARHIAGVTRQPASV